MSEIEGVQREPEPTEAEVKVTDRRLFTLDGQLRHKLPVEDPDGGTVAAPAPAASAEASDDRGQSGFERRPVEEPQGIDFTILLNAMAQPALLFLGEIPHPTTGQPRVDLEQARLQIDMLQLLRVKCRGNLTSDEEGLLDRILYQLRMLYVARANDPSA